LKQTQKKLKKRRHKFVTGDLERKNKKTVGRRERKTRAKGHLTWCSGWGWGGSQTRAPAKTQKAQADTACQTQKRGKKWVNRFTTAAEKKGPRRARGEARQWYARGEGRTGNDARRKREPKKKRKKPPIVYGGQGEKETENGFMSEGGGSKINQHVNWRKNGPRFGRQLRGETKYRTQRRGNSKNAQARSTNVRREGKRKQTTNDDHPVSRKERINTEKTGRTH